MFCLVTKGVFKPFSSPKLSVLLDLLNFGHPTWEGRPHCSGRRPHACESYSCKYTPQSPYLLGANHFQPPTKFSVHTAHPLTRCRQVHLTAFLRLTNTHLSHPCSTRVVTAPGFESIPPPGRHTDGLHNLGQCLHPVAKPSNQRYRDHSHN